MIQFCENYKKFNQNEISLLVCPIFHLHTIFNVELLPGGGQAQCKMGRAQTPTFFGSQATMGGSRQPRVAWCTKPCMLAHEK